MKKNEINGNQDIEKMLKDKMNELSGTVECFDKISVRAFPEKDEDFSESGFTVSGLENITGKHRAAPFLKIGAFVAAFVICLGVIPNTSLGHNLFAHFSRTDKKLYREIIAEIKEEISEHDYAVYDMSIEEYKAYDVLINPLYPCPFEDCGKDNINVRIFVRTYEECPTNQIYAVEYSGIYDESNFIAVAESKAKFSETELENAYLLVDKEFGADKSVIVDAIKENFIVPFSADAYIRDNYDNNISVASFDYYSIFKDGMTILPVDTQVLYYRYGTETRADSYHYDVYSTVSYDDGTKKISLTEGNKLWKNSVGYDGVSVMPEENKSYFSREKLFDKLLPSTDDEKAAYVVSEFPMTYEETEFEEFKLDFYYTADSDSYTIGYVAVPYEAHARFSTTMYYAPSAIVLSSGQPVIKLIGLNSGFTAEYGNDGSALFSFSDYADTKYEVNSEEEQNRLYGEEYEIEVKVEELRTE